jgi:hypothetical protein
MAAALKEQNARFAQLDRDRILDREEAWLLRQQDLQEARQQRDADVAAARVQRARDLEEADRLRSLDREEALLHDSQLRADVKDALLQSHQQIRDDQASMMTAINALARRSQDEPRSPPDTPRILDSSRQPNSSSSVAPPPLARVPNRHEDLDGNPVNVSPHPDLISLPRLVDVTPSHLQPPVNFPSSLLLTYERQGFPSDSLRNYYAGTYIAPLAPSRTARVQRDVQPAPLNMSLWTPYNGPVLNSVNPLHLVTFMVEWKKYQCTGTQHPLHHGISPDAAFSITPYCPDYQTYSDDEIWALLWDLFGPDNPSALKALFRDVAALLFVLVDNLPLYVFT